jgi:UDP-N-acetylglucosamine diphosphorylase / glucose-1-phosphate thymidylyltransferase / UDP-N-acetylgalactosamine diphosphorylase / glucosamine-1-phosphate N-acetyltransferase / galactosamine-1-phosphate N-acetyltransferase
MNYVLIDDDLIHQQLQPLTLTKPISALRCGILTLAEKWEKRLNTTISTISAAYLSEKFKTVLNEDNVFIYAQLLPDSDLVAAISALKINEKLVTKNQQILAFRAEKPVFDDLKSIVFASQIHTINFAWDLFLQNGDEIKKDFALITANRKSEEIKDVFTRIYQPENVFVEAGTSIKAAILNAEAGPIYIGKNAQIQEGAIIIGPVSIGENSIVAWGSKIRSNTTLGPNCRAGGEVGNAIFMANSNKAHDGFLGNSVIGEWCNLGANTNNSNLKNDYSEVKLHSFVSNQLEGTGLQFCGTIMGDYTKAGISTMFNTGTVVGVCANVYGADFQPKFIPSFSWGGSMTGFTEYRFDKAIAVINATMIRRNQSLSEAEIQILRHIFVNK